MDAPLTLLEQMAERDRHRTMAIRAAIGDAVDRVVANLDLGTATAAKRGRNPQFPYVPIIKYSAGGKQRTRQLRGLAYEDRTEAVARAQASIDATRRKLAEDLCRPRERALREQSVYRASLLRPSSMDVTSRNQRWTPHRQPPQRQNGQVNSEHIG